MKHKTYFGLFSAILLALTIAGCSSATPTAMPVPPKPTVVSPTTAPTATVARATSVPAQSSATPTTAAAPSANYNGEWKGTMSPGSEFSLTVENNRVTFVGLTYQGAAGTCQNAGFSIAKSVQNAPINGKDFSAQATDLTGAQITVVGSFKSNTEVAGTFTIKGTTATCGAYQINGTFTAQKGSAVISEPQAANSTPAGDSASQTLRAFFDAINRADQPG